MHALLKFAILGAAGLAVASASAFSAPKHGPTRTGIDTRRAVTYSRDVAPIVDRYCTDCHRPGQVAPFSLTGYDDAKRRALLIARVTTMRYMPPWKAAPCPGGFVGERRLSDGDIATLGRWAASGAPEGDPRDLPPQPEYSMGWDAGEPDSVFIMPAPYHISADGNDVYRCFVIPTHFGEDRYLSGIDIRPGNRKVVHHVIVYLDTTGTARNLANKDGEPGYTSYGGPGFLPGGTLGGWAPGKMC